MSSEKDLDQNENMKVVRRKMEPLVSNLNKIKPGGYEGENLMHIWLIQTLSQKILPVPGPCTKVTTTLHKKILL